MELSAQGLAKGRHETCGKLRDLRQMCCPVSAAPRGASTHPWPRAVCQHLVVILHGADRWGRDLLAGILVVILHYADC